MGGELADCVKEAQRDGAIDGKQNPQALARHCAGVHAGAEALHDGGVKPAQIKSAAEADDRADPDRLARGIDRRHASCY